MRTSSLTGIRLACVIPAVCLVIGLFTPRAQAASDLSDRLRRRIETGVIVGEMSVRGELIHAVATLPLAYERLDFAPVWIAQDRPTAQADSLISLLRGAVDEGLRPEDYHTDELTALRSALNTPTHEMNADTLGLIDFELLATDAFLLYGSHLLRGRINPVTIDAEWHARVRDVDLISVLQEALSSGDIRGRLMHLEPPQAGYQRMKEALRRYRQIAANGGWPEIPSGRTLHANDTDARVPLLRRRLALTSDCVAGSDDSSATYDTTLVAAVQHFQKRHGLTADGSVGAKTIAAMNVPARQRAQQIRLNMERWRWLPQDLGDRYVLVNIAGFELDVVEAGQVTKTTRVVVGKSFRRTPVFSDRMTYIVLNPYWNVPRKLAIQDILPQVRKDPGYLNKQGIRVYQGLGDSKVSVDPSMVDWSALTGSSFPYWLRQDPGPLNALGQVKFMFPNEFNIYLHDTPHRELFAKEERSFSSGCIRVENAVELAEFLLKDDPRWTKEAVETALHNDVDKTITLHGTVDVHLLYWTAWVSDDGSINFRNDIYERDRLLDEAMGELPPHPDDNP